MRRKEREHARLVRSVGHSALDKASRSVFGNTAKLAPLISWRIADPGVG